MILSKKEIKLLISGIDYIYAEAEEKLAMLQNLGVVTAHQEVLYLSYIEELRDKLLEEKEKI